MLVPKSQCFSPQMNNFGTQGNLKNENPGDHFGDTSKTALQIQPTINLPILAEIHCYLSALKHNNFLSGPERVKRSVMSSF